MKQGILQIAKMQYIYIYIIVTLCVFSIIYLEILACTILWRVGVWGGAEDAC